MLDVSPIEMVRVYVMMLDTFLWVPEGTKYVTVNHVGNVSAWYSKPSPWEGIWDGGSRHRESVAHVIGEFDYEKMIEEIDV